MTYPPEVKAHALLEAKKPGTIRDAAARVGIPYLTLKEWCRKARLNKNTGRAGKYPPELMKKVVEASESGTKIMAVAAEYKIPTTTLSNWRRKAGIAVRSHGGHLRKDQ